LTLLTQTRKKMIGEKALLQGRRSQAQGDQKNVPMGMQIKLQYDAKTPPRKKKKKGQKGKEMYQGEAKKNMITRIAGRPPKLFGASGGYKFTTETGGSKTETFRWRGTRNDQQPEMESG